MLWALHSNRDDKREVIQWIYCSSSYWTNMVVLRCVNFFFFLFWHTFSREQLEAGNVGCTTVAHVWRWQWGESWSLSLPWTGESRSLQTCKKCDKNLKKRKFEMKTLRWGLYRTQRGTWKIYNNLQLLVLMLFQNMLLQSLGEMGVMSLWYHTHIHEGEIKPHFLTLNLTYETISLGIKQKLKWSTICFRPFHSLLLTLLEAAWQLEKEAQELRQTLIAC